MEYDNIGNSLMNYDNNDITESREVFIGTTNQQTSCAGCFNMDIILSLIQGVRFCHIMVEIGVISLLTTYLTDIRNEKLIIATMIMNVFEGMSGLLSIAATFFIERLGCYFTVFIFSIVYSLGLVLLWISSLSHSLNLTFLCNMVSREPTCTKKLELPFLYMALILLASGKAGSHSSIEYFRKDQLNAHCCNKRHEKDRGYKVFLFLLKTSTGNVGMLIYFSLLKRKMIFPSILRKLGSLVLCNPIIGYCFTFGMLYAVKSWTIRFGISALAIGFGLALFETGKPYYFIDEHFRCVNSKLGNDTSLSSNHCFKNPVDDEERKTTTSRPSCTLRSSGSSSSSSSSTNRSSSRDHDQVAVDGTTRSKSATFLIRLLPICLTCSIYGVVNSVGNTLPGKNMDRSFIHHSEVNNSEEVTTVIDADMPLAMLLIIMHLSRLSSVHLFDCLFSLEQLLHIMARIELGMFFSIFCCFIAKSVEAKRLGVIKEHDLLDKPDVVVPMSLYWLLPQYICLGVMMGLAGGGLQGFFKYELPKRMKNYASAFGEAVIGVGILLSIVIVAISENTSKLGGRPSWIADSINRSRLDKFYETLTGICGFNVLLFHFFSTRTYSKLQEDTYKAWLNHELN